MWKKGETWVVIVGSLAGRPVIVDGFFDFFYDRGGEVFGELEESVLGHLSDHIGGGDHYWRWCDGRFLYDRPGVRRGGNLRPTSFVGEEGVAICTSFSDALVFVNEGGGHCDLLKGVGWCKGDGVWFVSRALLLSLVGRSFGIWVSAVEVGDKFRGVFQMLHGFPGAVTRGETLPLDKVMQFTPPSLPAYLLYFFDLVLFFSIDKVWCRSGIIRPVQRRLFIGCQEVRVDHRVYLPLGRQF